jgi:hypothetical protein
MAVLPAPIKNLCTVRVILSLSVRQDADTSVVQRFGNMAVAAHRIWSQGCPVKFKDPFHG